MLLATDITHAKYQALEHDRLSAQLQQAQKMEAVGQLTGGVAHDFNNLLTAILGTLELAEMGAREPNQVVRYVSLARDAATRASALTQRLLAFSRKQSLHPIPTNLNRLLSGIAPLLRTTIGETIELEVTPADELWTCEVDTGQLENVIVNLAVNARDAMPHGGVLRIVTSNHTCPKRVIAPEAPEAGQFVRLRVEDTGSGMSPEITSQVFEPFFTTKDVGRGSGLGLSMVYGFVKQSGGHVTLDSTLGEGTVVAIDLPRSFAQVADPEPPQTPTPEEPSDGPLILVVEDDALVRQVSEGMLGRLGYRTIARSDARSALMALEAHPEVALLFTDIVLPGGVSGIELAYEARKLRPELRVLHTTGYAEEALVWDRLDATIEVLEKPFSKDQLAGKVKKILRFKPA
jgi:nitrogen-specific signal transduction histidine kinase/CheY-like chemotaxis protein